MLSVPSALGVTAGVVVIIAVVSVAVALLIGRGIHVADKAAAPTVPEVVDLAAVAADDAYLEALACGQKQSNGDPHLTQMFAAIRDEARDGAGSRSHPTQQ